MATIEVINVTLIEPKLKHPTIFNRFDELVTGESFMIDNDHGPKPLYYELIGERGNIFSWEYIEKGPERWTVIITKNSDNSVIESNTTISETDVKKAEFLKSIGAQFKCGDSTPSDKYEYFPVSASQDMNKWQLDYLVNHLINTHHAYMISTIRVVEGLTKEVADHHGENCPELVRLSQYSISFYENLLSHIEKMETIVKPTIDFLTSKKSGNENGEVLPNILEKTISNMQKDNIVIAEDLAYFKRLTKNYSAPADACNSHSYLYQKLSEFDADLQLYIYAENDILFPKALALEKELSK